MHVNIGPYLTWWGPYQIAKLLTKVGVSEERCRKIGKWLADTWVNDVCQFVYERRRRRIEVQIDDYDIWSLDHTLALIILPALKKIRDNNDGTPCTDREDASHLLANDEEGYSTDRWLYILDEMIFAFEHIVNDEWDVELWKNGGWTDENLAKRRAIADRIDNGLRLFGKYYQALWT